MNLGSESYDVCIVGASIAGNYLTYLLSKSNLKIIIIEDHKEIGIPFQCAGIISQKLNKLIELPTNIILNRVTTAKIVSPSGKRIIQTLLIILPRDINRLNTASKMVRDIC